MEMTLKASPRTERGKQLVKLRDSGVLPGVVYGPKDEATPMSLDLGEFRRVFDAAGESTIISLQGIGEENKDVLVQDVAYDPVSGMPIHVDLYAIERGKKLQVNVALEFAGEPPVEKTGGVVTKVLHEVEIESLPRHLPHYIQVDLSALTEVGMQIHVSDLTVPEGVEILNNPDDVVVVVSEVEEEPEEEPEVVDMDAIEVEHKGKDEEAESSTDESAGDESKEGE